VAIREDWRRLTRASQKPAAPSLKDAFRLKFSGRSIGHHRLKNRSVHNLLDASTDEWSIVIAPFGSLSMFNEIPPPLLQPRRLGDLLLPNRVVMAPLTRGRASNSGHVPNDLMREKQNN
jgi:NADH:flavin oxidoreductase / NADH oxidase family